MSASSSRRPPPDLSRQDQYRPRSIAELATEANEGLWEPSKPLKHWLRTAEKARKNGNAHVEAGDYELAFIEYARAATLVLEKLPTHREYQTLLTATQRANLGLVSCHPFLACDHRFESLYSWSRTVKRSWITLASSSQSWSTNTKHG